MHNILPQSKTGCKIQKLLRLEGIEKSQYLKSDLKNIIEC